MKSAVPRTPMATLGAVAPSGPVSAADGRVPVPAVRSDAVGVPTMLVAGAPRCGKTAVTTALLAVAAPVTSAYVAYRHGEQEQAYAYVPGRRRSRPLSLEQVRAGDAGMLVPGGPGRPPRRVDVLYPAELLRHVSLVDTPGVGGFDKVYTEIVLDALGGGAALLFVAEASTALQPAQLDFLAQVEQRDVAVTFVLTKIDVHPEWPAVLAANQKLVHDHTPGLATAPWYAVSTVRSCDGAAPAGVEEGARGLAGLGVLALRRALTEPAPGERVVDTPAGDAPTVAAPRVADGATDAHWTYVLDREIGMYGGAAAEQLMVDLAAIRDRCVRAAASPDGCVRLPYLFDRELHGLSVRTTRAVDEAAGAIMRTVFGEILAGPPDRAAVARVRRATRRAVDEADSGSPEWDRVLLVTATAGVAVTAGQGAVAGLTAVEPPPIDDQLLPPIGVGLSANCYRAGSPGDDGSRCRDWLDRTVHTLETELGRELARRFAYLREALAVVASETVDHGVLLA